MKTSGPTISLVIFALLLLVSCSGHKDCQGHRHRVKTEMGGYL